MRLYHFTSHEEALAIIAEGFRLSDGLACYLLFDRPDAVHPVGPAVAVLEIEVELAPGPAAGGRYYFSGGQLARARVRLYDVGAQEFRGDRPA